MSINKWSNVVTVAELQDEPILSEELHELIERVGLCDEPPVGVVLNFAKVTYLNSSNLAQLLELRKTLLDGKAGLRLCELAESLRDLFLITGLDRIFIIDDNTAAALAMINMTDPSEDYENTAHGEEEILS